MTNLRTKYALTAVALCLAAGFSAASVQAQDATPGADESRTCAVMTPEENVALVESLYVALDEGDGETVDTILSDVLVHDSDRYGLDDDATTNKDEIALAEAKAMFYPGSTTEVTDIFGTDTKVVAATTWTITEHNILGESVVLDENLEIDAITIFTIECGEIVEMQTVTDELELLTGLGIVEPIGTPAP